MPMLIVKKNGKKILDFSFTDDIVTIGRAETNDLWLPNKDISRYHAALVRSSLKGGYFIRDLGGFYPIKIAEELVYRRLLRDGDSISIGPYTLEYKVEANDNDIFEPVSGKYVKPSDGSNPTIYVDLGSIPKLPPEKKRTLVDILSRVKILSVLSEGTLRNILDPILEDLRLTRIAIVIVNEDKSKVCISKENVGVGSRKFPKPKFWPRKLIVENYRGGQAIFAPLNAAKDKTSNYFMCFEKEDRFTDDDIEYIKCIANTLCGKVDLQERTEEILPEETLDWPGRIIGNSKSMKEIKEKVKKISSSDGNVLILGETGVGKEEVAKAIWENSSRRDKVFNSIVCTNIPKDLVESELFGHERGAFSGAVTQKKGLVETSDGGTLFLDEIGNLPLDVQEKLLTFTEKREFRRVGGLKTIKVDVRIICATNKNLCELVEKGKFRLDLYHRIKVHEIDIPPLRERREDIPLLACFFLDTFAKSKLKDTVFISHETMNLLWEHYDWPGNVRELKNCIEAILDSMPKESKIVFSTGIPKDIKEKLSHTKMSEGKSEIAWSVVHKSLKEVEKAHIKRILSETKGNKTEAAKILKISRPTLNKKIKDYGI